MQDNYDPAPLFTSCCIAAIVGVIALFWGGRLFDIPAAGRKRRRRGAARRMSSGMRAAFFTGIVSAWHVPVAFAASSEPQSGDGIGFSAFIIIALLLLAALGIAVRNFRGRERESRQREKRAAWISEAAQKDRLTGFANRQHFESLLMKSVASATQEGFTLVSLDLTLYRTMVGHKGERAADGLVRAVAAALIRCLPGSIYSRSASGSFLVLSKALAEPELNAIPDDLKDRLADSEDAREYGRFSFGYSHYPASASSGNALIAMSRRHRYSVDCRAIFTQNNN